MPSSSLPENGTPSPNGQGRLYGEAQNVLGRGARSTSLREWIGLLWNGKWIILAACLLSMAAAGAYVHSVPDRYRTSTLLYLNQDKGKSLGDLRGGNNRSSFFEEDRTLENELFLLSNSTVIPNRVAERLRRLGRHPDTGAPLPILVTAQGDSLPVERVARRVQGTIGARPAGGEGVDALRIHVSSSSPDQAALLANLYAEEYIRRTKERSRQSIQASRQFLEKQADKLEKDVKRAENRIQRYMQQSGAVSLDQEAGRIVSQISALESKRAELRIERKMKSARLDTLRAALEKAKPNLADRLSAGINEQLARVQTEKAELQARIDRIQRRNPIPEGDGAQPEELRKMRNRIAVLARRADSLAQTYVSKSLKAGLRGSGEGSIGTVVDKRQQAAQLRIELNSLQARIDNVNQQLQEARAKLQDVPKQSMQLAQLQRERRSAEEIFGFVREKLQEIRLSEQSEVGFAEIVQPAPISRAPIGPSMQPNLILALIFGFGAGSGIVLVWEKLDTRVYEPDDIKRKGYPMAGVVPSMDTLIDEQFDGDSRIQIDDYTVGTELVLLTSPMSAPAEAYRRIRTNLQFTRPDEALNVIAVTSADKGEGKTTTTANLALAMASAGERTVLIDADLRNPRQHRIFDRSRTPGLTQLLFDDPRQYDAFATGIDNLSLIPAGEKVPNPAELLGSQRMQTLIDDLTEHFDVVLFDTPPVLLFSDALALTSHCDGSLIVAAAGTSDSRAVDHAAEQVEHVGSSFLGCILNRYDSGRSTLYGYGYNYGYAQSYEQLSDYYYEQSRESRKSGLRAWWNGS